MPGSIEGSKVTAGLTPMGAVVGYLFLSAFIFFLSAQPGQAKYASIVMEASSGRVLQEINANTRNYPASLTKMMTLYLVFEALEKKRLTLDTPLSVSARAARQPSSKLGLKKGQSLTVKQAILSIVTKSANDAATVLAENMSGTERRFALAMTAKARRLGMKRSTFRNASGLPHRSQLSTARDMAILAARLLKDFPQYYGFFSTASFTYNGVKLKNHNTLLTNYEGTDGIKTGYIRASGYNLVASVKRGGRRLIGVVFGGRSAKSRNRQMTRLMDGGFRALAIRAETAPGNNGGPSLKNRTILRRAAGNDWGVQVGAYKKRKPAYDAARRAMGKAPGFLAQGRIKIVPLHKKNGGALYRGRILGLSRREASRACAILQRRNVPCMKLRAKPVPQLASR